MKAPTQALTQSPTICLNMIVKDESHIIKDTLTKLCSKIKFDRWIISDTGSTDNTPTIIEDFFEERGIEGKIYYDKWKNFAHNRTLALHHAFNLTDYLLVFDADDEIQGDFKLPDKLTDDGYYFKFGCSINYYERILLVNNRKRWKYLSVLHEYIMCVDTPNYSKGRIEGNYTTISGRSGNRSKDPNKYYNDGQVLEKEYNRLTAEGEDPHNLRRRYAFYCANSYRDANRPELAVKWYKTTLTHDSWVQEKYVSCIYLYDCYVKIGEKETGLYYLTEAIKYDPDRPEWIASLLRYCYDNGFFKLAMGYYSVFKDFFENKYMKGEIEMNSKLFVNVSEYDFHVPFNMIIACWNAKDFETGIKMFEIIFTKKCVVYSKAQIECVIRNLEFFMDHVKASKDDSYKAKFFKLANEYFKYMHSNNYANFDHIEWLKKYGETSGNDLDVSYIYPKKIIAFDESQCKDSKNILVYTGFSNLPWNISYLKDNALGGSEKAVCYVVMELSKILGKDWKIYVSGGVGPEKVDNIEFINQNDLHSLVKTKPFHSVIVLRYISFYEMFPNTCFYKSYVWAQDFELINYGCNSSVDKILSRWDKYIEKYICLTEWHKDVFIKIYPCMKNKIILNNNGINPNFFPKYIKKKKNSFVYTSRPERGLVVLLNLWSQILEKIPDATLKISTYCDFPSNESENEMKKIIDRHPSSIKHLGKLDTNKLYNLMAETEYWLYPCIYAETSCITALEMLMSEVICVYYPLAGLPYTLSNLGFKVEPGNEIETIMSLTDEMKDSMKVKGKEYAITCSWENRAKVWGNLMFDSHI